jgi:formate dehydrogenase (coenzyme F420) beta subunit
MISELKAKVKELFKTNQVGLVIGYQRASDGVLTVPCFVEKEEDADKLVWDAYCVYNLSNYLNPVRNNEMLRNENKISNGVKDFPGKRKGIIAKPCDVRSIIVLLQENQLRREDVYIIGVECSGVIDEKRLRLGAKDAQESAAFGIKCKSCKSSMPSVYDYLLKDKEKQGKIPEDKDEYESVRKFEAKSALERLKFWEEEFSRCIRCYACRQVCPMCYCPKCVADQAMPAWFSKGANLKGNLSWNVIRAMHLAGRCIDCGECERVCPVGIPLGELNKKIEKDVKELFKYEAGLDAEQKPFLASFDKDDPGGWIK